MKIASYILLNVLTLLLFNSCSIYGTYESRFNDGNNGSWIKLKKDSTFEFITFNHLVGYGYTRGGWMIQNDSIYLYEFVKKPPTTNLIKELNDNKKRIKILDLKEEPILPHYLKINGIIDSVYSDWNGIYSYDDKYSEVNEIQIYDIGTMENELGQLLADFKTNCKTCSYEIKIDWYNVGFKSIYSLDTIWIHKNNRLYPLDSYDLIKGYSKSIFYKKIDTLKPNSFWIESWNNMKKGYE